METPHKVKSKPSLLPEAVISFFAKMGRRIIGGVLITTFIGILISLWSYHPSDPGFNRATDAIPQNLLYTPGSYTADLLLQTIGLGAIVLALPFLTWGIRVYRQKNLPWFWYHLIALPIMVASWSAAASTIPPINDWPLATGYGGALGDIIINWFNNRVLFIFSNSLPFCVVTLVFSILGASLFSLTLGLDKGEWGTIKNKVKNLLYNFWLIIIILVKKPFQKKYANMGLLASILKAKKTTKKPKEEIITSPLAKTVRNIARPKKAETGKRGQREKQRDLNLGEAGHFILPTLDLLTPARSSGGETLSKEALEQNARLLESVLDDFGIKGEIISVRPGPVVTLYELEPAPGTKSARIIGLADDIARSMSAISARVATVPGRNVIGIELPNTTRETVYHRELLSSTRFENSDALLAIGLGKDIGGSSVIVDLASMPHLLVAGTTGSGKSVGINTMIVSLLYKMTPEELRFIMVDPKMLELSVYDGIPHLLTPVVTEAKKAVVALKWAVREMEDRYRAMSKIGVRNLAAYNKKVKDASAKGKPLTRKVQTGFDKENGEPIFEIQEFDFDILPLIVIVIDEMADLMLVAGKDVEATVQRLAQMARAAGIHLIMATQRPSVDVITGTIKANFPTRIGFQVTSKIDSRTILGTQGAEQLLGKGDMLFMAGGGRITRVHGPFISDNEVEKVVTAIKKNGVPEYLNEVVEEPDGGFDASLGYESDGRHAETLYDKAVDIVLRDRKASTSYIQRRLKIGYNKAANLIEEMEENGVISGPNHAGKREVLGPDHDEIT